MNPNLRRLLLFLYEAELEAMEAETERLDAEQRKREDAYWSRVAIGGPTNQPGLETSTK